MFIVSRMKRLGRMIRDGEYRELLCHLYYRASSVLKGIDLAYTSCDELCLSEEIGHYYSDSGGPDLEVVCEALGISKNDSIVDIGCGKGGAIITLSKYPFRSIVGVDISEQLLYTAKANLSKLKINRCEVICSDATSFYDLDAFNYIYMFNPFPCNVMNDVITNINMSLSRVPRTITIIYKNPVCSDIIIDNSTFTVMNQFNHSGLPFYIYVNK